MKTRDLGEKVKIFHGLSPTQMKRIEPELQEFEYQSGDWVVEEGDQGMAMYIVLSGTVEVWRKVGRRKKGFCLGTLKTGDCFGEMCLIDCQKRSAGVRAKTRLTVMRFPFQAMNKLFIDDPELFGLLLLNISREISRRLRAGDASLVEFALPKHGGRRRSRGSRSAA